MIELSAGSLSALCFAFSWRAFQRCRTIAAAATPPSNASSDDALERSLAERESNLELVLAQRNVKGLSRAAFASGTGLFFLALASGPGHRLEGVEALALGGVGALGCLGLQRRIGSLAEGWRRATNRRRRRQGVDPPQGTG